jgi:SAM-dependent methyltransferase
VKATFATQRKAWSSPPVDDIGYLPAAELLSWSDQTLLDLIDEMEDNRYKGWRNWNGNWRRVFGLDTTSNAVVLDYGCGVGLEALQYAKHRNSVLLADICDANVFLAAHVLRLHGYEPGAEIVLQKTPPFAFLADESVDVVHCNGVLHHIPRPEPVVRQFAKWLKPGGEVRLMVYSDQAWRIATNTEPPERVEEHEDFEKYVRHWDAVGNYTDWYDAERIAKRFGEWFTIDICEPLIKNEAYLGVVLKKL